MWWIHANSSKHLNGWVQLLEKSTCQVWTIIARMKHGRNGNLSAKNLRTWVSLPKSMVHQNLISGHDFHVKWPKAGILFFLFLCMQSFQSPSEAAQIISDHHYPVNHPFRWVNFSWRLPNWEEFPAIFSGLWPSHDRGLGSAPQS